MRKVNYDKFPSTKISGTILRGWNDIHTLLMECFKSRKVLAVELYAGVREDEVINELKSLSPTLLINTRDLMKPENDRAFYDKGCSFWLCDEPISERLL